MSVSTGDIALRVVAGHHRRSTDPIYLPRTLGLDPTAEASEMQLLLAAKELGLKARAVHSNWLRLPNNTMPALGEILAAPFVIQLFGQLHLLVEARHWRNPDGDEPPPAHVGD